MQEKNPNLFPIVAVLTAAGILTSICGLLFLAIDQMSESRVLSASPGLRSERESSLLLESLPSQIVGTHKATVLSVESLSTESLNVESLNVDSLNVEDARTEGFWVASGSYDTTAAVWQVGLDSNELAELEHSGQVNALAFIPGKRIATERDRSSAGSTDSPAARLITGSGSGEIKLWDLPSGEATTTIAGRSGRVVSLAADASGRFFASGTSKGTLKVWPVAEIAVQKSQTNLRGTVLKETGPEIQALAFHPTDENLLLSGDRVGNLRVWDIEQGVSVLTLSGNADRILSLAVSPNGRYVASGSQDTLIRIWSLQTGQLARTLSGHEAAVSDIAFSSDGKLLASSSYDESIKTWDWANAKERCTLEGHSGPVYTVAFADESTLVSGGTDGTVRRWALKAPVNRACLK